MGSEGVVMYGEESKMSGRKKYNDKRTEIERRWMVEKGEKGMI